METILARCAGLDVHKESVEACVRRIEPDGRVHSETRHWGTMTRDLLEMAEGRVARCSTFTGMGTDNQGNRIAFGSPTTDYGVMQGEYWGARAAQQGTFTHI